MLSRLRFCTCETPFGDARRAAKRGILGALILGLASLLPAPVVAQSTTEIGLFTDWRAYSYRQNGGTRCTMASAPTKDEGNYTRRGPIWAFVMHRPQDGASGEVGFHMGYPLQNGKTVEVTIGQRSFNLFASGEGAYAWPEDEPSLLAAMRAGSTMVVKGTSSRGTATTDTYSLSGFTAAFRAIGSACGI